jgi:hypothetical protein
VGCVAPAVQKYPPSHGPLVALAAVVWQYSPAVHSVQSLATLLFDGVAWNRPGGQGVGTAPLVQ